MPLDITAFEDPLLTGATPPMFTKEHVWNQDKPVMLIYASCHGRTLMEYFRTRPDVMGAFNIIRLETSMMLTAFNSGVDKEIHNRASVVKIFRQADVVVTYNMGARHGGLSLDVIGKHLRPDAVVVTFVAPNFSAFCPFGYGYTSTIPVYHALDQGHSPEHVWAIFEHGDLDCLFQMRWRFEIGRLIDKSSYHDVAIHEFIIRNHKKVKMWTAPAHPTMIPMAYFGNEIAFKLGFTREPEEKILGMDYMLGAMRGQPETDYEFKYFKFEYPQRHLHDAGGMAYYRSCFWAIVQAWQSGGFVHPGND